jgi:hypothetical protein
LSLRARLLRYAGPALFGPALVSASLWFGMSPNIASAGEYNEPAHFTAVSAARPLSAISTATTPLRWKAKRTSTPNAAELDPFAEPTTVEPSPEAAQAVVHAVAQPARGWNTTRIDGSVRPVQYAESEPASDPFGDRGSHRGGSPTLMLQAAAQDSAPLPGQFRPLNPPSTPLPENTLPENTLPEATIPETGNTPASPPRSFAPPPIGNDGYLPEASPNPEYPAYPEGGRKPCNRIYNDRDCCEVETNIQAFRMRLKNDTIRNISLDISPPFVANASEEENREQRVDRLRLAGKRAWHNQRGEVIATGHLANLLFGDVIIADDEGKSVARLPINSLGDDDLCFLTAWYRLPFEGVTSYEQFAGRNWLPSTFHWQASAMCNKPLYFEELQAERYGHVTGPFTQPVISGAHFFLNIAALPYKMAINPPTECQYQLGYYRPGSCAPWMIPPIPLSLRGAAAQTTAVLGGIYLIP